MFHLPLFLPAPNLPTRPKTSIPRPKAVPLCRTRVPTDATTAAALIQSAVRTALIAGRTRLCVDVLTAAVDPRARTYDTASAAVLTRALVAALQPVLPAQNPAVQLVVPGPAAALRVRTWLAEAQIEDVSVAVLGVKEEQFTHQTHQPDEHEDQKDHVQVQKTPDAFVVLDPPAQGDSIMDLRRLIQRAQKERLPIVIHNHPRRDALYSMLGYGGSIPFELTKFEPAFILAPFALQPKRPEDVNEPTTPPPRFVVLRIYPDKWALWRFVGEEASFARPRKTDPVEMEQLDEYILCEEFDSRPTDNQLVFAVKSALG